MDIKSGNISSTTRERMVPPEIQAMQMELQHHPKLKAELAAPDAVKTFEDGLAIIAAYVDVVLHGDYPGEQIGQMAGVLTRKLYDKRMGSGAGIILPATE
jgi:hypothetical protein